jgi:diacylglycerol kinase
MDANMKKNSFRYQLKSFGWALKGLVVFFKTEVKAKIHSIFVALVVVSGLYFKLSISEWCLICLTIGLVFISEIFNTILEKTADTIPDKYDRSRGTIKDMGAGAVLFSSVVSIIIGMLIFIPKISELWF